jgi:hypothetical protein
MQELAASKWLKVCLLFLVLGLSPGLNGCGSTSNLPSFNINGTKWFVYHTVDGTAGIVEADPFSFTQSSGENKITGTTSQSLGLSGDINGSNISFTFTWTEADQSTSMYAYSGSFNTDGTLMTGVWTSTNPNAPSGTWNAVIDIAPPVNITGNWNVSHTTIGTPGEQGPDLFSLTQNTNSTGDNITGKTSQGLDIRGRTGSFSVFFSWVGSDGTTTFLYTGSVNISATSMSGTWRDTSGHSGTWSATPGS